MKVGIMTFFYAHNYGAVLQAYALKKWFRNHHAEADIIDYRNPAICKNYEKKLHQNIHLQDIWHLKYLKEKILFNWKSPQLQTEWEKQWQAFEQFIEAELLSDSAPEIDQLKDYDLLITGSDQVWTSWLTGGLDPVYFLNVNTHAKKISYGASVFEGYVKKDEITFFQRYLKDFSAISVREETLAESLSKTCGLHAATVVDPVLLLKKEDYIPLLPDKIKCSKEYLLAYFVTEDKDFQESLQKFAEKQKTELIEIHYYGTKKQKSEGHVADAGPREFLSYIAHAKMVFTNSFHGMIFSILFQKEFYSVYAKDARKDHLLNSLDLAERHITTLHDMAPNPINYLAVQEKINLYRKDSEKFLLDILGR